LKICAGFPTIESGLKDLRVLKTTQSAFVNFVNDDYRKHFN
jgi:urate oxidase